MVRCTVYAASDASGKLGYGVVEWTDESICHEVEKRMWKTLPPLQPMHIFLKEFYAVVRAVETLTAKHRGKLIVLAGGIILGGDLVTLLFSIQFFNVVFCAEKQKTKTETS